MTKSLKQYESLDLLPVGDLLSPDNRFYVPAYQRGYRWGAEQVIQLIEDLVEFEGRKEDNKSAFYCLQPLVVKPIQVEDSDYFEVIDGQQRLTTILLINQALRQIQYEEERDEDQKKYFTRAAKDAFEIKYETREDSSEWLPKMGRTLFDLEAYAEMDNANCDYSHFAEVFKAAYNKLEGLGDRDSLKKNLRQNTYFIWYLPSESDSNNVDIFDRLNAGKIRLNNAELVKALFLQRSNVPRSKDTSHNSAMSEFSVRQKIAQEWDMIERRLHDDNFWGFIYRKKKHGLEYDSRIEYLLDLMQGKTKNDKEVRDFTFGKYVKSYRDMLDNGGKDDVSKRVDWVVDEWDKVKRLFDLITEWYEEREVYHRMGFILEYSDTHTLKSFEQELPSLLHSDRIAKLDDIIRKIVGGIKSTQLFYKENYLSEILFLYNILLEDRRHNATARFSFMNYTNIEQEKGWDQEHIASRTDHEIEDKKKNELAKDVIELITGKPPVQKLVQDELIYVLAESTETLDDAETDLCQDLLSVLNKPEEVNAEEVFTKINQHFKTDVDSFRMFKDGKTDEKDFIWNFALLNSSTNRSYGNSLYPVKRRRILADEFEVYTPVGTRNVFEKAYSRKIDHFFAWTRTDAKAYWEDIKNVVKDYVTLTDIE